MNTNKMCPQTTCYIYKIDSSYVCDKLSGHYFLVLARIEHKEIIRTQTKLVPGRPVAYIREILLIYAASRTDIICFVLARIQNKEII